MPTTTPRRQRVQPKTDTLDDLEIKEVRPRQPRQKEVDVTKVLGGTITDKLSATVAFGMSDNMLKSVGRDYAITPKEAYNITHPGLLIIEHYIPTATIKTKLPVEIANHVELILVTVAEYVTRIVSVFVEKRFNRTLQQQGMMQQQTATQPVQRSVPVQPGTSEPDYTDYDNTDLPLDNMVAQTGQVIKQTSPGPTGFNFEELVADGVITGDNGNNY